MKMNFVRTRCRDPSGESLRRLGLSFRDRQRSDPRGTTPHDSLTLNTSGKRHQAMPGATNINQTSPRIV
ncbi:unnamed protein product, partial [Iphiclides podalirius]